MASANQKRQAVCLQYSKIIGRNIYSQSLRDYCYKPYRDGRFYSDCSSSISGAYKMAGYGFGNLNTAGMHYNLKTVKAIKISKGQIVNIGELRIGDMLLFKGSDPSRPLQIGHVEMVYKITGTSASSVTICGHGSGNPSYKNLKDYCSMRYGNGRGLVEVVRHIQDDGAPPTPPTPTKSYLSVGDKGSEVKTMQTMLIKCGFSCGSAGADGDFGSGTETALIKFQKQYNLEVDGRYGQASKTKLESVYSATTKPVVSTGNSIVRDGQIHANNFCGAGIATDGLWGPATKKAAIKVLQTAMNLDYGVRLVVDGIWGIKSEAALKGHTVRLGETQYMVTALQILLMLKGYNPNGLENPGQFGSGCEAAVYRYQNDKGLNADKIAGYNTFKSLIS